MDRAFVESLLPHRDPVLFVDRVVEIEPGVRAVAVHEVRADAFWCAGHFPGEPIMPGVLVAEALAQTAALVHLAAHPEDRGRPVYLVGMDKLRFRRPVRPGDTLKLEVRKTGERRRMATFEAEATVDGQRVANGTFLATLPDREG